MLIFVKLIDLTISSSVWPMSHPSSRHPRCRTTPSVVSTRASLVTRRQSPCSLPVACRRTDTSSSSFRELARQTSVNWSSIFAVSSFTCTGIIELIPHRNWKKTYIMYVRSMSMQHQFSFPPWTTFHGRHFWSDTGSNFIIIIIIIIIITWFIRCWQNAAEYNHELNQ